MNRDLAKFKQTEKGYYNSCGDGFSKTGSCLKSWAEDRDASVLKDYQEEFGLDNNMITVNLNASGNGVVLMEGMNLPSQNYKGKFFSGLQMELTAVPAAGAVFTGWSDGVTDNPRIVTPKDGDTFTAKFN
jgi:hypothetical protein